MSFPPLSPEGRGEEQPQRSRGKGTRRKGTWRGRNSRPKDFGNYERSVSDSHCLPKRRESIEATKQHATASEGVIRVPANTGKCSSKQQQQNPWGQESVPADSRVVHGVSDSLASSGGDTGNSEDGSEREWHTVTTRRRLSCTSQDRDSQGMNSRTLDRAHNNRVLFDGGRGKRGDFRGLNYRGRGRSHSRGPGSGRWGK